MRSKHIKLIILAFTVLSLAIVAGALLLKKSPMRLLADLPVNQLPLDKIFTEAATNPQFVQASFYGVDSFRNGVAEGLGHIRYSNGKQIFGYSGGGSGAKVTAVFADKTSLEYKSCEEALHVPVPVGRELFISGEGTHITTPVSAFGGALGGAARIEFNNIKYCGLITAVRY